MADIQATIEGSLTDYYTQRSNDPDRAVRVGWRDKVAQHRRFAVLAGVITHAKNAHFSVADIGCGLGDFSTFLDAAGYTDFAYVGYDRATAMVEDASTMYPTRKFSQIGKASDIEPADYCVASGIFSGKFDIGQTEWTNYIFATLGAMNARSKLGFAFNALTKYSDAHLMKSELYYADPCLLFDHCKTHFSRNVALLHDYDEYDFTIIVRKAG